MTPSAPVLSRASSLLFIAGLMLVLMWLGGSAVSADFEAHLRMSISPGGDEVTALQSGTARAYAVLTYQDATETRLTIRVLSPSGIVLYQYSDVYSGSGQRSIEITGREILAGHISAAEVQSTELVAAVAMAEEAPTSSAKRFRAGDTTFYVAGKLDSLLAALESYPLSPETLGNLDAARSLLAEVEEQAWRIRTDVADDQLDTEIAELDELVTDTDDAVADALSGIDTTTEQAWRDGAYTIQLRKNDEIGASVGFDWEVGPNGVPGTPVAALPTSTAESTTTPTSTKTQEPTTTPTERPATATSVPASASLAQVTSTPQPSLLDSHTVVPTATSLPAVESAARGTPITQARAATPASGGLSPTEEIGPPAQESRMGYPAPPAFGNASPEPTTLARAMTQNEVRPGAEIASAPSDSGVAEEPGETLLAPQEVREFPATRILAMASALALGIVALWLRARI